MKKPLPLTVWSLLCPKNVVCPGTVPTTVTTAGPTFCTDCVTVVWISVVLRVKVCEGLVLLAGSTC